MKDFEWVVNPTELPGMIENFCFTCSNGFDCSGFSCSGFKVDTEPPTV